MKYYLNAQEVAAELGISVPTVYSYVSRGWLRSERTGTQAHRYAVEDVERLKQRKAARKNPSVIASNALNWGTPVLDSAITLITNEQIFYRGNNVVDLARHASVEQVAALIWADDQAQADAMFADIRLNVPQIEFSGLTSYERLMAVLPFAASADLSAYDLRPAALLKTAARVLHLLVGTAAGVQAIEHDIITTLSDAWIPELPQATDLLRIALIVCADHELNVSSFTARCVASADASLYAVVGAGLAALTGRKHGGETGLTELLLAELLHSDDVQATLHQKMRLGLRLTGFGHVLYPNGDPRGRFLMQQIAAIFPEHPAVQVAQQGISEVQAVLGEHPTIDFGLALLRHVLQLPAGSGMTLFALGRTIGWIGHALEQYAADTLIRPRARYVGKPAQD